MLRRYSPMLIKIFIVYCIFVAALYLFQNRLVYFPDTQRPDPAQYGVPDMGIVSVPTYDGLHIEGWYAPPENDKPVIVYFHGNALHHGVRGHRVLPYLDAGYGVLLAAYRGFGGNPGKPSEADFYKDAQSWIDWLQDTIPSDRVVLYGESLGTGVALEAALHNDVTAIILESPFTRLAHIARRQYFFVPVIDALLVNRFENDRKIKQIHTPLLILHGENDMVIPVDMSRKLYQLANEPKRRITYPDVGHNSLPGAGIAQDVIQFLEEQKQ